MWPLDYFKKKREKEEQRRRQEEENARLQKLEQERAIPLSSPKGRAHKDKLCLHSMEFRFVNIINSGRLNNKATTKTP